MAELPKAAEVALFWLARGSARGRRRVPATIFSMFVEHFFLLEEEPASRKAVHACRLACAHWRARRPQDLGRYRLKKNFLRFLYGA